MSIEMLQSEVSALPVRQRRKLMAFMIALEDAQPAGTVENTDKLWAAEAVRRRDEVRSGCVKTIPGDVALARVRKAVVR